MDLENCPPGRYSHVLQCVYHVPFLNDRKWSRSALIPQYTEVQREEESTLN